MGFRGQLASPKQQPEEKVWTCASSLGGEKPLLTALPPGGWHMAEDSGARAVLATPVGCSGQPHLMRENPLPCTSPGNNSGAFLGSGETLGAQSETTAVAHVPVTSQPTSCLPEGLPGTGGEEESS